MFGFVFARKAEHSIKIGQLGAQVVGDGLAEAHPDDAAFALGQSEPIVNADCDVHASADQPARPIRPSHPPAPGAGRRLVVRCCRRGVARQRHPARTGCNTHVTPSLDGCGQAHARAPGGRFATP